MDYLGLLCMPLSVFVVGVVLLLLRNRHGFKRLGIYLTFIGGVLTLVAGSYVLTYPTVKELEKKHHLLFSTAPGEVEAVMIEPSDGDNRSHLELVASPAKVTNRADVQRVVNALRSARRFSPNHPSAQWSCLLTIESNGDEVTVRVTDTKSDENGVLIYWSSSRTDGWVIGNYRCDELRAVLEDLAQFKPGPR